MANTHSSSASTTAKKWTLGTTDIFHSRLFEIRSILAVLIVHYGEFKVGDGRSSDEVIFLTIQQTAGAVSELEQLAYELQGTGEIGDLALHLMWARSLLEMLEDMGQSEGWRFTMSDNIMSGYLAAIERRISQAIDDVNQNHDKHVRKVH